MRNDDDTTVDRTRPELLVGPLGLIQLEPGDLRVQQTARGQVENLHQLGAVPPVRRLDARLVRDAEERHGQRATTEADDREVARAAARTAAASREGLVGAHEVQDHVCAEPVGRLADLLGAVRRER